MKKNWSDEFVYHWKYYKTPARPSTSELKSIKEKIKEKGKDAKILILGATQEYRNMCGQLNLHVTLIDFSKKNYMYLTKEVKNKVKEKFVQGNWLDTGVNEKFDIILADNMINMLKKKDINKLLSNISKMLNDGGYFMPRTYIRDKNEKYTGTKAIKEYRKLNKKLGPCGSIRNFILASYNFKKDYTVFTDTWRIIKQTYEKGLLKKKEYENYKKLSLNRKFSFFMPLRKDFEKNISKYFKIKKTFYGVENISRESFQYMF